MRQTQEEMVEELLGQTFTAEEVPAHPARIWWRNGSFLTKFPRAPVRMVEVRFRTAPATKDGDYTVYEARSVDTSNPENVYGEWLKQEYPKGARPHEQ